MSLLNERSIEGDGRPGGDRRKAYIATVRVGDAVTLLTNGYESSPSKRAVLEDLTSTATDRLAGWHR